MENDKDNIIKELMGKILRLKTELIEVKHERDAIERQNSLMLVEKKFSLKM